MNRVKHPEVGGAGSVTRKVSGGVVCEHGNAFQ